MFPSPTRSSLWFEGQISSHCDHPVHLHENVVSPAIYNADGSCESLPWRRETESEIMIEGET